MQIRRFILIGLSLLFPALLNGAEILTLESALTKALATHPEVSAEKANFDAEKMSVSSKQWPGDPMLGLMYEKNQNFMQQQMGPMTSLSVSQDIAFPAKYYFRGRIQESHAAQTKEGLAQTQLTLRRKVVTAYFQLYANQRIKDLIDAQKDTVRQVARIAESRHSLGAVTQQDEMKAHVEQTTVENERFSVQQEEEALHARLSLLLGYAAKERFVLPKEGLPLPEARLPTDIGELVTGSSRRVRQDAILVQEAKLQNQLALWEYAPDFRLSARTVVGANRPDDNFVFTMDLSFPLWFFMRQSPEVHAASARSKAAQFKLEAAKREILTDAQEIATKVRTHQNLIKVFSTTLIPQAQSTLNASRTAYQAGRANFFELLDSARSIFAIRAAYYRHIAEYVEQLVLLEELVGTSLSSLPFGAFS